MVKCFSWDLEVLLDPLTNATRPCDFEGVAMRCPAQRTKWLQELYLGAFRPPLHHRAFGRVSLPVSLLPAPALPSPPESRGVPPSQRSRHQLRPP